MSSLSLEAVTKNYGALPVLKNIDLEVESGEFLVLVGPSGCGKSTLLNVITGLSDIASGRILIEGQDVTHSKPKDRDIAMVFQSYALYPNMNVAENMGFGLEMRKIPARQRNALIDEVAEQLQLTPYLKHKPAKLSGGQRQRVAMGRALVRRPKIFLFDEPLSNLDAQLRVKMRTELKRLHQRLGATIIYVTHDQIEAMTLATRIVIMKQGIIQQIGTPWQVYNQPINSFVASFIGSPAINLVPGKFMAATGSIEIMEAGGDGKKSVRLKLPEHIAPHAYDGQELILGLRPEAISDNGSHSQAHSQAQPAQAHPTMQAVDVHIDMLEPTGPETLAVIRWQGYELTARISRDADYKKSSPMSFLFDLNQAMLFDAKSQQNLNQ